MVTIRERTIVEVLVQEYPTPRSADEILGKIIKLKRKFRAIRSSKSMGQLLRISQAYRQVLIP